MNTKLWKTVVIAGLVAVLTAAFLLLGAVALSLKAEDPEKQIGIWIFPILCGGAATAALLGRKMYGEKNFIVSMAAGGVYLLIIGGLALPISDGFSIGGFFLKLGLVMTICMIIGVWKGNSKRLNQRKAAKRAGKMYRGKR